MSDELAVIDDVEVVQSPSTLNLFDAPDPESVIVRAAQIAKPLANVIRKQQLSVGIQGREYVRVEGWTLLGSMLGVFPYCVWTRETEDGWEARVEARTRDGSIVGSAEAQCTRSEKEWGPNPSKGKPRDDYALRSMAQTRATSKALRQPLGFVMTLAGFNATPAEEMPNVVEGKATRATAASGDTLTEAQHKLIEALVHKLALDRDKIKQNLGVEHMTDLSKAQASKLIEQLKQAESADDESDVPF